MPGEVYGQEQKVNSGTEYRFYFLFFACIQECWMAGMAGEAQLPVPGTRTYGLTWYQCLHQGGVPQDVLSQGIWSLRKGFLGNLLPLFLWTLLYEPSMQYASPTIYPTVHFPSGFLSVFTQMLLSELRPWVRSCFGTWARGSGLHPWGAMITDNASPMQCPMALMCRPAYTQSSTNWSPELLRRNRNCNNMAVKINEKPSLKIYIYMEKQLFIYTLGTRNNTPAS